MESILATLMDFEQFMILRDGRKDYKKLSALNAPLSLLITARFRNVIKLYY